MALLTQSGRTALASSLKSQSIHLAWGTGNPLWESTHTQTFTFEEDRIQLPHFPLKNLHIMDSSEGYTVDCQAGVITRLESSALPDSITVSYTIDTPAESMQATQLIHEVGRRMIDEVSFCIGDPEGLLVTPTGRFSATETSTNQLYFHGTFDFEDASTETIRELGIFIGTEVLDDCKSGQRYFLPSELKNPGILLVLENTVPLIRTAATREAFSFVVTL